MPAQGTGYRRASAAALEMFWLAPAVIAMRMPLIAMETLGPPSARSESRRAFDEKTTAATQGLMAAHMSLAFAAPNFWMAVMKGVDPSVAFENAAGNAAAAALGPSRKSVRRNYRRLSSRGKG